MLTADWVVLGLLALFCLTGITAGFGKGLKFFTSGIFGFIISIIVCYCIGGFIYGLTFVQELLGRFVSLLEDKNWFLNFLINIRIDLIVYYIALFIVVSIIRLITVLIIKNIAEAKNRAMKTVNKTLGLIFFAAVYILLLLLVFHIISLIGGSTAEDFAANISDSAIGLDFIFENNPLLTIIHSIRG